MEGQGKGKGGKGMNGSRPDRVREKIDDPVYYHVRTTQRRNSRHHGAHGQRAFT